MDKLKYIKLENEDGSYSSSIPLAVDSDHVNVNGEKLTNVIVNKADSSTVLDLSTKIEIQKSRIDSMSSLQEGSTTGDAELIDGRIDKDGIIWDNIGNNIRKFESDLSELNGKKYLSPALYGWNFSSNSEPPVIGNYNAYGHCSIELHKGDVIKLVSPGVKFKYIYKNNQNIYVNSSFRTSDFQVQEDGLYYLTYSFTPEVAVVNLLNELGKAFEIVLNSNSLVGKYISQQSKIKNIVTGLDETGREMLFNILNKIVFTEDMTDNIKNFINYIANKTDLVINLENKRIANGNGDIWSLDGFCITKDYNWNEPIHSVTFYFECDSDNIQIGRVMQFLDELGNVSDFVALGLEGRANKEISWSSENLIYGLRTTLYSALRDNDYIYKTDTGDIIFAGKNSKYANKNNIYEQD